MICKILLILIVLIIILNEFKTQENFESITNDDLIHVKIFVSDTCPACKAYKLIHPKIEKKIIDKYKNVEFHLIENIPENEHLFIENDIKYIPSLIVQKKDKILKNEKNINFENVKDLIDKIKEIK